jgi:hypothetical protein
LLAEIHDLGGKGEQMTKPVILRADLRVQHDYIIRVSRAWLEQMIERFPIRVDWRNEGIEIHAANSITTHSLDLGREHLLQIYSSSKLDLVRSSQDRCVGDVV